MSEEEKEAIYELEKFRRIKVLYGNTFAIHIEQMKQLQNNMKIVFNLLQKQKSELEKKDKIIDEMAARAYLTEEEREEMKKDIYNNPNHKGFADFVKRYFERKVENESNS